MVWNEYEARKRSWLIGSGPVEEQLLNICISVAKGMEWSGCHRREGMEWMWTLGVELVIRTRDKPDKQFTTNALLIGVEKSEVYT